MSEFLQRVESEIQHRHLLLRGQKILVAVSGGADSMALLHVLHSLATKNRWRIFIAHFNHQLRGRASDADEKLVRKMAAELKLPVVVGGADVMVFAKKNKLSIEMAARKLRHEFLARVASGKNISTVALAHHADDQVELFFLRLLRGVGGEGLAGMKWRSPSPADRKITLVRPLLGFSKMELLAFAQNNKIHFREDATNASSDFLRNRIRNELLPLLQKNYQPGLSKTVLRLMEIVGAESELVSTVARQWLENKSRKRKAESGKYGFDQMPVAVQRRILQLQLTECGVVSDFDLVEQLRTQPGKFVSVNSGLSVARDAAGKLNCKKSLAVGFNSDERKLTLRGGAGRVDFGGMKFSWRIGVREKFLPPPRQAGAEAFDADKVGNKIILRHWRPGDRFQPIGLKSPAKLQDLFVNAKIPAARRRGLVLAESVRGIFWVEGLRISEKFKLTAATRRQLDWSWQPANKTCPADFSQAYCRP